MTSHFTKWLVDPTGQVVARYGPQVRPSSKKLRQEVERALPD